jgi:hypothetical protein
MVAMRANVLRNETEEKNMRVMNLTDCDNKFAPHFKENGFSLQSSNGKRELPSKL